MDAEPGPTKPRHKRLRLATEEYARADVACSVTICVAGRRPVFTRDELAQAAIEVLRSQVVATGVAVYGYCVMSDHVHLVLSASGTCDIPTFVGRYKNMAQRAVWAHGLHGRFWQTSFWDHFLRAEEDLEKTVQYVLDNPVRKGLSQTWRDYPHSGSMVLDA